MTITEVVKMERFNDYEKWLRYTTRSEATFSTYSMCVSKFIKEAGDNPNKMDVINFFDKQLKEGLKLRTRITYMFAIRSFFRFLNRLDEIRDLKVLQSESEEPTDVRWVPADDLIKILGACRDSTDRVTVRLLFHVGLRIGEMMQVRVSDLEGGFLTVHTEKKRVSSQLDKVPLDGDTIKDIERHIRILALKPAHFLIFGSRDAVYYRLKRVCELAGVRYYNPQSFRHGRSTQLKSAGWDDTYIGRFLRHNPSMDRFTPVTQRYIHITPEDLKKKMKETEDGKVQETKIG